MHLNLMNQLPEVESLISIPTGPQGPKRYIGFEVAGDPPPRSLAEVQRALRTRG